MLVTLSGIVTLVRDLQLEKAKAPMLVTPFGIVTLVRDVQPAKADQSMLVTLSGIAYAAKAPGHCTKVVLSLLNRTPNASLA